MPIPAEVYETNRRVLWGLCYRMTGDAAEAEDIVQETFVRALATPPRETSGPWQPWLVSVAMNLARDYLRRRRRAYAGPWLPSPVPVEELTSLPASDSATVSSPAARYDLAESVTFGFLLALEALTARQRAVLLLRDVFDYSTSETARALAMTEANVKVVLHRARRVMRAYDTSHSVERRVLEERTRHTLERFLLCLGLGDVEGLERLLAEDVILVSDGGGEVTALREPVCGRERVVRLVTRLYEVYRDTTRISVRRLNGLPAALVERAKVRDGHATRFTLHCDVDDEGRIDALRFVFAPSKLVAVR